MPLGDAGGLFCYKIRKHFDQDITALLDVVNLAIYDGVVHIARICFGGMATGPKQAKFISRLRSRGHSEQAIGRLHCPIGIVDVIGKETAIIAASMTTQLL